jgi:hypothetical protein
VPAVEVKGIEKAMRAPRFCFSTQISAAMRAHQSLADCKSQPCAAGNARQAGVHLVEAFEDALAFISGMPGPSSLTRNTMMLAIVGSLPRRCGMLPGIFDRILDQIPMMVSRRGQSAQTPGKPASIWTSNLFLGVTGLTSPPFDDLFKIHFSRERVREPASMRENPIDC